MPLNTAAPIKPLGTFPAAFANDIFGGLHNVADTTERNAIPAARRVEGMLCMVRASGHIYKLEANLTTWTVHIRSTLEDDLADVIELAGYAYSYGTQALSDAADAQADATYALTFLYGLSYEGPAGLHWKTAVRVVSTTNLTLSGEQTVDGVALEEFDRILVAGQIDKTENGPYTVNTGAWVRTNDANDTTAGSGSPGVDPYMMMVVQEGTHEGEIWQLVTPRPITLGVTELTFEQRVESASVDEASVRAALGDAAGDVDINGQSLTNVDEVDGRDVSADGAALDAHIANTSNPHAVTAAQVGAVVGPVSAVDDRIATFDGTTGDLIQDGGATIASVRDRSTHTGSQAISTVTGLQAALDAKVAGPASATDNAVARFDATTGKLVQNSLVTISDAGSIALPASQTVDGRDVSVDGAKLDGIADNAAALTASAPANVTKAAAAVGVATAAARADHKHDVATATAVATGTANAEGSSTSLARADHVHATLVTSAAPETVTKSAALVGTSSEPARADHKHDIFTDTPVAVGASNAQGTAASLARSDHVHSHGNQAAGGSLHAAATTSVNGFMSSSDKTKLDTMPGAWAWCEREFYGDAMDYDDLVPIVGGQSSSGFTTVGGNEVRVPSAGTYLLIYSSSGSLDALDNPSTWFSRVYVGATQKISIRHRRDSAGLSDYDNGRTGTSVVVITTPSTQGITVVVEEDTVSGTGLVEEIGNLTVVRLA